jgi:hypothetical protein
LLHRAYLLDPVAQVAGQRRVAEQSLSNFLATGDEVVGRKVQDVDGGGRISQNLLQLLEVPGLEGVESRVADGVVRVGSEENQDLDLLVKGQE